MPSPRNPNGIRCRVIFYTAPAPAFDGDKTSNSVHEQAFESNTRNAELSQRIIPKEIPASPTRLCTVEMGTQAVAYAFACIVRLPPVHVSACAEKRHTKPPRPKSARSPPSSRSWFYHENTIFFYCTPLDRIMALYDINYLKAKFFIQTSGGHIALPDLESYSSATVIL